MGGNLFFAGTGAVLETVGVAIDDALLCGWHARVERARRHLGWDRTAPGSPPAPAIVARRHATGASLALQAPVDQLFTATELNEWALCATVFERDPVRWANVTVDLLADYLEDASDPADVIPPVLEEHAALARLAVRAASERRPDVVTLIEAASARRVGHLLDEATLTLGSGKGSQSFSLDALPATDTVPWASLHAIPIAAITGSNGKTTTVRLVAACARAHGWRDGFNCTDGVVIDRKLVASGDYSGPAGTRLVLRNTSVEAAVLETARGGILRRGLAADRADVAIVTNISPDHFGEYGIDDLDGLADVKLSITHLLDRDGLLVLNADDALLCAKSDVLQQRLGWQPTLGWFSRNYDHPALVQHRVLEGVTCGVRAGHLWLSSGNREHDLGAINAMPLTVAATATYNVENLAGAALVATKLGVPPAVIAQVFTAFGRDLADNAGRLMRFDIGGVKIILDYAHNPDGLRGVMHVAQQLRAPDGRIGMLLGHAGNRLNADIEELALVATEFGPDLIVVKEDEGHLRGRQQGEVPAIIQNALLRTGMPLAAVPICPSEVDAALLALDWARPGDALVLLIHSSSARTRMLEILQTRRDT
ncbi:MAG: Mur ligase family protein [Proteobacteria bacterium]|nr:Mur ligase family protein [Pseudomonadota bacterium]